MIMNDNNRTGMTVKTLPELSPLLILSFKLVRSNSFKHELPCKFSESEKYSTAKCNRFPSFLVRKSSTVAPLERRYSTH